VGAIVQKVLLEEEKIKRTIDAVTNDAFTVLDFVAAFKNEYPIDWRRLVERFGQFGSKRRYTVTTYFSNRLDVYSRKPNSILEPFTRYKQAKFKDYRRTTTVERGLWKSMDSSFQKEEKKAMI
jgi:hypothetical protein